MLLSYQLGEMKLEVHVFLVLVCVFLECKHNMNHDRFPLPEHIFHKKKKKVTKSKQPMASLRYQHLTIDRLHIYRVLKYTGSYRTTTTHFQFFHMQSLCAALF